MSETNNKIKTSEIMIIVGGSVDEPCYSIRYYDLSDNEWHVGFSSYWLPYVMDWKKLYFEIVEPVEHVESVEPVEHVESAKSTGTSKVKEFWQKVKQKYESKGGQYIDRVLNDIVEETIKDMEGGKEMIDVENYDTERNWEAEYKRLKNEADVMYKQLDQAQKELNCKNRELTQLEEKLYDLRRDKEYVDGKTYAYELAIRYLGTEKKG